jgi:hypothetical protein
MVKGERPAAEKKRKEEGKRKKRESTTEKERNEKAQQKVEEEGKHNRKRRSGKAQERERESPSFLVGAPLHLQVGCWQQLLESIPLQRLATFKMLRWPSFCDGNPSCHNTLPTLQ